MPQLAGSFFKRHAITPKGSDGLYAHGFRYSFTPLPGYFSPFPHGTRPLSVTREYLGLPGGPGRFTADYRSPPLLGTTHNRPATFAYRTITVYGAAFQRLRLAANFLTVRPPGRKVSTLPQPHTRNPCRVSHACGLA